MESKSIGLFNAAFTFITVVVMAFACGNETTVADETRALLKARTWSVYSVQMDGIDKTSMFSGMKINFEDQVYTAQNGGFIWGSDLRLSWAFQDTEATKFAIGSGPTVYIQELTKSSMTLRLRWSLDDFGGGATSPESGLYVFEFRR